MTRGARVLAARARVSARSGRRPLPEPGAGRGPGAHAALRRQPRHRDAGLPRRRAGEPVRRDAGAVPGGRLPGPGEVRLPQRRRRRGRARPTLLGRTVFCLLPAPDGVRRARPTAVAVVPDGVPAGAGGARRHRRDRRQRAVGRRAAASATGSPSSAPAWSAAASPGCSPRIPGVEVTLVDVDPTRADVAAALGRRLRRARRRARRTATWSCTPARRRPGCSSRSTCSAPDGDVLDLSWYGDARVDALARRRVPLRRGWRSGPARSARSRRRAGGRRTRADRLALALTCCATRRSTRCSPASRRSTSCPR